MSETLKNQLNRILNFRLSSNSKIRKILSLAEIILEQRKFFCFKISESMQNYNTSYHDLQSMVSPSPWNFIKYFKIKRILIILIYFKTKIGSFKSYELAFLMNRSNICSQKPISRKWSTSLKITFGLSILYGPFLDIPVMLVLENTSPSNFQFPRSYDEQQLIPWERK